MTPIRFTRKRFIILTTLGVLLPTAFLAYLSITLQREILDFQNRILDEYALFSVDYAVSQVQEGIRDREREVQMHLRMAGILQTFDPEEALRDAEERYPFIEHAYFQRVGGSRMFASDAAEADDALVSRTSTTPHGFLKLGSLLDLRRESAERVLDEILSEETVSHLIERDEIHFFRGQEEEQGTPFHLTAFGLFDADGEPYGVAGFFLKLPYVRERFLANLLVEAITAAQGRFSPNFGKYLTFVIADHKGELVYIHRPPGTKIASEDLEFISQAQLWDVLPGWAVRLVYASPHGHPSRRSVWLSNTLLLALMTLIAVSGILISMRFSLRQMELSNLKSHFVSNITHELKTPLSAIRLYTETLQAKRVKDEVQEKKFLGIINKESVRLTHLINNILDFSRIEMGRKRYKLEPASVSAIVQEVAESYAFQLRDKGFELHVDVDEKLPLLYLDKDALSQAVLNLIDNAMKYSNSHKEIDVSARRSAGPPDEITISVRDHGVGIPPSEQKKIFEAFYRVEKGLEHDVKGSGLGLAVVQHVAEAHGGTVDVESTRGSGSTFTIRLPVEET